MKNEKHLLEVRFGDFVKTKTFQGLVVYVYKTEATLLPEHGGSMCRVKKEDIIEVIKGYSWQEGMK
jgi:hypothetical protein